jgi:hypothetical protein
MEARRQHREQYLRHASRSQADGSVRDRAGTRRYLDILAAIDGLGAIHRKEDRSEVKENKQMVELLHHGCRV